MTAMRLSAVPEAKLSRFDRLVQEAREAFGRDPSYAADVIERARVYGTAPRSTARRR